MLKIKVYIIVISQLISLSAAADPFGQQTAPNLKDNLCHHLLNFAPELGRVDLISPLPWPLHKFSLEVSARLEADSNPGIEIGVLKVSRPEAPNLSEAPARLAYIRDILSMSHQNTLDSVNSEDDEELIILGEDGDWLHSMETWATSHYFDALGIEHMVVLLHQSLRVVILPSGNHPLNQKAIQLYRQSGTHISVESMGRDHFDERRNTIVLTNLNLRENDHIWTESSQAVSEKLTDTPTREIVVNVVNARRDLGFHLDPDSIWPGGLTNLTFLLSSTFDFSHRMSFRTDWVDERLPKNVRDAMANAQRMAKQAGKPTKFLGLRKPDGTWFLTVPDFFDQETNRDQSVIDNETNDETQALLNQIPQDSPRVRKYELFRFYGNTQIGSPQMSRELEEIGISLTGQNLDAISDVFINQNSNQKLFYRIMSRLNGGADITHRVDLMQSGWLDFVRSQRQ